MAKRKLVKIGTINRLTKTINGVLSRELPQDIKASLCSVLEGILMETDQYSGFNQNYWLDRGCEQYRELGRELPSEERNKYIIGENGVKDTSFRSSVVHPGCEGEYSRVYFTKNKGGNEC